MGSKGLTIQAAICPFCGSTDARLETYSNNGVADYAHILCPSCGLKTKDLLDADILFDGQEYTIEEE